MKLQEAIVKSNPGDQIHVKGLKLIMKDDGALYYNTKERPQELACLNRKYFQRNDWVIVSAEPNILDFQEWWESNDITGCGTAKPSFEAGDKNGQLKQWINHKELREAVEAVIQSGSIVDPGAKQRLVYAFQDLKPLNGRKKNEN